MSSHFAWIQYSLDCFIARLFQVLQDEYNVFIIISRGKGLQKIRAEKVLFHTRARAEFILPVQKFSFSNN
jgi:hypothetical protein